MALLGRTRGVFSKMVSDIKRITFWTHILVQIIFFSFYGYSIYSNIENLPFLITYSLLLTISTITFITYLYSHKKHTKQPKGFSRSMRIIKYLTNGTMVILNIIEMVSFPASDLTKILLIISGISLLVQIIVELIRIFIERYADDLTRSLEMDLAFFKGLAKLKEVKGTFFQVLDAPLEAIANKLENKKPEISKQDQKLNEIGKDFDEKLKEKKAQKKIQKIQEKAETKKRSEENAQKQKKEIGQHLRTIGSHIFKNKKNKEDAE